jgi:MoxR-like ATPase
MNNENKWHQIIHRASSIILDKQNEIELSLTCILAGGHLLIEDVPGVGKTTLVQVLAKLLDLPHSRIQFTSDLLPADIIGNSIYDADKKEFHFVAGPLFAHLVLADELNRANPRTQSALLQAMEEGHVSVDRTTHALPSPFFLIATQNPRTQTGTFPLPESQLDRFLMSISMNYASYQSEVAIFQGQDPRHQMKDLTPLITKNLLLEAQSAVNQVRVSELLAKYITEILTFSRQHQDLYVPLSTRTGLALARAAKARAFLQGRDFVLPDDVQIIAPSVLSHRLGGMDGIAYGRTKAFELVKAVAIPT